MENRKHSFDSRLDAASLTELYEDDLEHASLIFDQFIQSAPLLMAEIDEAYRSGVVEPFRQKVHKMKPVFSFVGLTHLTEAAETLEKSCHQIAQLHEIESLYLQLQTRFSKDFEIVRAEADRLTQIA